MKKLLLIAGAGGLMLGAAALHHAQSKPVATVVGRANRPTRVPFRASLVKRLKVPAGFRVNIYAQGLGNPRMMTVGPNGTVYVTRRDQDDVVMLRDSNGDGRAEQKRVVASKLNRVHGITLHGDSLYLATVKQVYAAEVQRDGTLSTPRVLIRDLPDGGQHPNRTLAFGPDGNMYISVGSTCNACEETNPEHATMLRAQADGTQRKVYARGLRNTVGFAWHPTTKELWGMDHGRDWLGDNIPPEELNRIKPSRKYGWPYVYGKREVDKTFDNPRGMTKAAYARQTEPAVLTYQAHSAPIGMVFYNRQQFPAAMRGDAFIAMRGSWNRGRPTGYKVVRLRFKNGQPQGFEDFVTGFLTNNGKSQFARLAGVAVAQDGSLLVSDDENGVIYRVSYAKPR